MPYYPGEQTSDPEITLRAQAQDYEMAAARAAESAEQFESDAARLRTDAATFLRRAAEHVAAADRLVSLDEVAVGK